MAHFKALMEQGESGLHNLPGCCEGLIDYIENNANPFKVTNPGLTIFDLPDKAIIKTVDDEFQGLLDAIEKAKQNEIDEEADNIRKQFDPDYEINMTPELFAEVDRILEEIGYNDMLRETGFDDEELDSGVDADGNHIFSPEWQSKFIAEAQTRPETFKQLIETGFLGQV
jgi:hypothetical protein